jgi:hypothetical protein
MTERSAWAELHRSRRLEDARRLATTIAAMEFEVEVRDARGRSIAAADEPDSSAAAYFVMVRPQDCAELRDVLSEIIAEQDEFDAMLDRKARTVGRAQRAFLFVLIIILVVLAALNLIEL